MLKLRYYVESNGHKLFKTIPYTPDNEAAAKAEAYDGDAEIFEDEVAEAIDDRIEETATQLDAIEAQVTYTAMMTDTLLGV